MSADQDHNRTAKFFIVLQQLVVRYNVFVLSGTHVNLTSDTSNIMPSGTKCL